MVISKEFVQQTRDLARQFVAASDRANALGAQYAHRGEADELTPESDLVNLTDAPILDAQLAAFYETLGGLLAPLSDADKKAIYALL